MIPAVSRLCRFSTRLTSQLVRKEMHAMTRMFQKVRISSQSSTESTENTATSANFHNAVFVGTALTVTAYAFFNNEVKNRVDELRKEGKVEELLYSIDFDFSKLSPIDSHALKIVGKEIKTLDIPFSKKPLETLQALPKYFLNLQELSVYFPKPEVLSHTLGISVPEKTYKKSAVMAICQLKELRSLSFSSRLEADLLEKVCTLPHLESLGFQTVSSCMDEVFQKLNTAKNLTTLRLFIQVCGKVEIPLLPQVKHLTLTSTTYNSHQFNLESLQTLLSLETLELSNISLHTLPKLEHVRSLKVDGTFIGFEDEKDLLPRFKNCPKLERLHLKTIYCKKFLQHLASLQGLKELLFDFSIADSKLESLEKQEWIDAIYELQKKLPHTKFIFNPIYKINFGVGI